MILTRRALFELAAGLITALGVKVDKYRGKIPMAFTGTHVDALGNTWHIWQPITLRHPSPLNVEDDDRIRYDIGVTKDGQVTAFCSVERNGTVINRQQLEITEMPKPAIWSNIE